MARFSINEADNYGASKNSFFSLKDDGDTAVIRFLYNDINDVEGVAVHEVQVGDKKIDVECLRSYNEPIENCPLCSAEYRVNAKLFIPIYDEANKESKIWTRGKSYFGDLSSLCSRYHPLVSTPIEIERIGKKGDTNTKYQPYPRQSDNARIEDFPEIKAEGTAFLVKSKEDLEYYLRTGAFPDDKKSSQRDTRQYEHRASRETPATPIRRRPTYSEEDKF